MVSLALLKKRGINEDSLRAALAGDPLGMDPAKGMVNPSDPAELKDKREKVASLLRRVRSRIQESMNRNFADFKTYYALDRAWDTPFRQISPTLVAELMDKDPNDDRVYKAFKDWGLTSMISEERNAKDPSKPKRTLNLPIFFNVFVPLVQAYVKIRWAKIMNDRRLTPFFEYVPAKLTGAAMAKCAAITDRVQIVSQQYGYYDVQKQAVLKMLHYGFCLQFVRESWHVEEQVRTATADDVALDELNHPRPNTAGTDEPTDTPSSEGQEPVGDQPPEEGAPPIAASAGQATGRKGLKEGDEFVAVEREGLRYHLPHPTRMFYDLAHGPFTINYDSGCEFMGYWRIERFRTIERSSFWNKDKIALGTVDLVSANPLFFQSVYATCAMAVPLQFLPPQSPVADGTAAAATFGAGGGPLDREKQLAQLYYGTEHGDQGVLITEYFEKLIPSEWGLGNYDCPVWFRFLVAGDGCTVLYCEPLPYTPAVYYGYDADESRTKNASMSMEILPFQDQFSNVLTQIILTAKQNLSNLVLVDQNQVSPTMFDKIQNMGETFFRKLNIFQFDSKQAAKFQNKVVEAVQSFKFPQGNTTELINVLKTILDVLERVLVMSSNEVGQAASHEQTREEIRNIAANTSSRLVFTTTPVDIAADAQKRQIYCALMNYGDADFYVHIPSDFPLTRDVLKNMGFTYVDHDTKVKGTHLTYDRYHVKKDSVAVSLWEFASGRDQQDRVNNEKIAMALANLFKTVMTNPLTAQAVGAQQALDWANYISYFAGLPRDFKLKSVAANTTPDQQQAEAQGQLQQVVETVLGTVNQQLKGELGPLLQEVQNNSRDISLIMNFLQKPGNPRNDTTQPNADSVPPGGAA